MNEQPSEAKQCRAETETLRLGRGVADFRRCKVRTKHPSGLCHHHRGDDSDGSVGGQYGAAIMSSTR